MRVLDASAVLRSDLNFSCGGFLIAPAVLDEIESARPAVAMENAVRGGLVKVVAPSKEALGRVNAAARKTGDLEWLSLADLETLALALEKKAPLETDDYGMQNVASELGVECEGQMQEGIEGARTWVKRCVGCGREYPPGPEKTCGVCGSTLARKRVG
jgi:UPF0271 protein